MGCPVRKNIVSSVISLIIETMVLGCITKANRTGRVEVVAEKGVEFFKNLFSVFWEVDELVDFILERGDDMLFIVV